MSKSRNWCFTLNNPTGNEDFVHSCLKMLIASKEIGASNTIHYQGYCEFNNPVPLSTVRNWLPRAHWEVRKGNQKQAVVYCLKDFMTEDGSLDIIHEDDSLADLIELGLKSFGLDTSMKLKDFLEGLIEQQTSKLLTLKKLIDAGKEEKDLWETDFETMTRHHRAMNHYRMLTVAKRHHEMEIIVLIGPTGTGKSKYCMDNYPNAYWKQRSDWWDGYAGEETVIMDEFYGWIPWDTLLRMCDRYPMMVQTKGGQVQFTSRRIVFTSNLAPKHWYKSERISFSAFIRRVKVWVYMKTLTDHLYFDIYSEFDASFNPSNPVCYIAQL